MERHVSNLWGLAREARRVVFQEYDVHLRLI